MTFIADIWMNEPPERPESRTPECYPQAARFVAY
jgi:hypothetical protein